MGRPCRVGTQIARGGLRDDTNRIYGTDLRGGAFSESGTMLAARKGLEGVLAGGRRSTVDKEYIKSRYNLELIRELELYVSSQMTYDA